MDFVTDAQPIGEPDAPIHDFYLASIGAARRLPCTLGPKVTPSVKLDVYGKHMVVERFEGTWQTHLLGPDGKRSLVDVPIPASLAEDELAQYFDDLYHEAATPSRPAVIRLP